MDDFHLFQRRKTTFTIEWGIFTEKTKDKQAFKGASSTYSDQGNQVLVLKGSFEILRTEVWIAGTPVPLREQWDSSTGIKVPVTGPGIFKADSMGVSAAGRWACYENGHRKFAQERYLPSWATTAQASDGSEHDKAEGGDKGPPWKFTF